MVAIRTGRDGDVPFMMKRALSDLRHMAAFRNIPNTQFNHYVHKLLEWHIYHGKVFIACDEDKTDDIFGFLLWDKTTIGVLVHYLYVRKDKDGPNMRKQGIARKLLTAAGVDADTQVTYTMRTAMFDFSPSWRKRVDNDPNVTHNLFLLFTLNLDKGWESRSPGP